MYLQDAPKLAARDIIGSHADPAIVTAPRLTQVRCILLGALAAHLGLAAMYASQSREPAFDLDRYYEIATAPGRPYVDHQVEHPIATVAVFRALAHLPGGRTGFGLGLVGLNVLADAAIVGALLWGWGEAAAAVFAVMVILVLDLFFNRVEPWSVAAATVAIAAWRRRRPGLAGAALALGGGLKLWPLVLAGVLLAPPPDDAGGAFRRTAVVPAIVAAIVAFMATAGVLAAGTLGLAGWRGLGQVLTFRGAHGWQIEGVVGSVLHLAGGTPRFESGSWRIGSTSGPVAIAMFALAAPIGIWCSWRGARTGRLGAGWLAAVSILLLASALVSAQYMIWLIPAAAISWTEDARGSTLLTALVVLLTTIFWSRFSAVLEHQTPALLLVVLRNVGLVAIVLVSLARMSRRRAA